VKERKRETDMSLIHCRALLNAAAYRTAKSFLIIS
jgi:hypothetical protein